MFSVLDEESDKDPDQFGFLHSRSFILLERKYLQSVKRTVRRREKKWSKMLQNVPRALQKKMPNRVYKGVPNSARATLWKTLLKVDQFRQKNADAQFATLYKNAQMDAAVVRQIDLDVARTWRTHSKFRERYGKWQKYAFRVLLAYSAFDTAVGYCQGMSQIAALFLIVFEHEESAFWALCSLMTEPPWTQKGMFLPGFPKLSEFVGYWEEILLRQLPKVFSHLENESLISQIYLTKWFLQNFLDRLPFRIAIRLWDCFILDGDGVILATTLVLFRLNQTRIRKLDFDQLTPFLQAQICNISIPDDTFFAQIQKALETVRVMRVMSPSSYPAPSRRAQTLPAATSPVPSGDKFPQKVQKSKTLKTEPNTRRATHDIPTATTRNDLMKDFTQTQKGRPMPIASPRKSTQKSDKVAKNPAPLPRQIRVQEAANGSESKVRFVLRL